MSWILLTMGNRPAELAAAIASIWGSRGEATVEIIVVANGATGPVEVPDEVMLVELDENLGVPGGRNGRMGGRRQLGGRIRLQHGGR